MRGGIWVASYLALWVAVALLALAVVALLALAVVALLRQVGVLHARLRPLGVHFAGEGPERASPAPDAHTWDYGTAAVTLVAFTSPGCDICASLRPGLAALERTYEDLAVRLVDHDRTTAQFFASFNVHSTPYVVGVDRSGAVRARGVANSLEQVEVMLEEVLSPAPTSGATDAVRWRGATEGADGATQT